MPPLKLLLVTGQIKLIGLIILYPKRVMIFTLNLDGT
jgi:hypothetical protein